MFFPLSNFTSISRNTNVIQCDNVLWVGRFEKRQWWMRNGLLHFLLHLQFKMQQCCNCRCTSCIPITTVPWICNVTLLQIKKITGKFVQVSHCHCTVISRRLFLLKSPTNACTTNCKRHIIAGFYSRIIFCLLGISNYGFINIGVVLGQKPSLFSFCPIVSTRQPRWILWIWLHHKRFQYYRSSRKIF